MQVVVPKSIKAIVLLNLQSYAGGRDLWGLKDTAKDQAKGWQVPIFNDGLIEVKVIIPRTCSSTMSLPTIPQEALKYAQDEAFQRQYRAVLKTPIEESPCTAGHSITMLHKDAALQVVGLQGGYHTAAVMGGVNSKVHAKRLAQASEVLIELQGESRSIGDRETSQASFRQPCLNVIPEEARLTLLCCVQLQGQPREMRL